MPFPNYIAEALFSFYILLGSQSWGYLMLRVGWPNIGSLDEEYKRGWAIVFGVIFAGATIAASLILFFLGLTPFTLPETMFVGIIFFFAAGAGLLSLKARYLGPLTLSLREKNAQAGTMQERGIVGNEHENFVKELRASLAEQPITEEVLEAETFERLGRALEGEEEFGAAGGGRAGAAESEEQQQESAKAKKILEEALSESGEKAEDESGGKWRMAKNENAIEQASRKMGAFTKQKPVDTAAEVKKPGSWLDAQMKGGAGEDRAKFAYGNAAEGKKPFFAGIFAKKEKAPAVVENKDGLGTQRPVGELLGQQKRVSEPGPEAFEFKIESRESLRAKGAQKVAPQTAPAAAVAGRQSRPLPFFGAITGQGKAQEKTYAKDKVGEIMRLIDEKKSSANISSGMNMEYARGESVSGPRYSKEKEAWAGVAAREEEQKKKAEEAKRQILEALKNSLRETPDMEKNAARKKSLSQEMPKSSRLVKKFGERGV